MQKKYKPLIFLAILIVIAIAIFFIAKINPNQGAILKDGTILKDSYFTDKVIIIHSISCSHCRVVIPILRQIEQENNKTFIYYDISIESEYKEVTNILTTRGLALEGVPTVIIYGKVYVGEKTKAQYLEAILNH